MEESFGKGHFVRNNADTCDSSSEYQDLDIEAELKLASELEQSPGDNKGQNFRDLGQMRSENI